MFLSILILENRKIFVGKRPSKFFDKGAATNITNNLKIITFETSFVVRTFFFVIFGITITLAHVFSFKVWIVSLMVLGFIYFGRWVFLRIFVGKSFFSKLLLAPRRLITILLFYAIPTGHQTKEFNEDILLVIIIVSNVYDLYFDKRQEVKRKNTIGRIESTRRNKYYGKQLPRYFTGLIIFFGKKPIIRSPLYFNVVSERGLYYLYFFKNKTY